MPARKQPAGARENPLRVVGDPVPVVGPSGSWVAVAPPPRTAYTPREMRQMMISEFGDWLRTQTNKQHRPFQEETILAYTNAALALSAWLDEVDIEVDFTGCDTVVLNRFFRAFYDSRSQGGTNTKQRNLRHLFTWLEGTHGHPHPYTSGLVRYAPVKGIRGRRGPGQQLRVSRLVPAARPRGLAHGPRSAGTRKPGLQVSPHCGPASARACRRPGPFCQTGVTHGTNESFWVKQGETGLSRQ